MNHEHPCSDQISGPCFPPRPSDFRHTNRRRSGSRARFVVIAGGLLLLAATLTLPAKDFLFGPTQQRAATIQGLRLARGPVPTAVPTAVPTPASQKAPKPNGMRFDVNLGPIAPPLYIKTADLLPPVREWRQPEFHQAVVATPTLDGTLGRANSAKSESDRSDPIDPVPAAAAAAPLNTGSIEALPSKPAELPGALPSASDLTIRFATLRTQASPASPTARVAALGNVVLVPDTAVPAPRVDSERLLTRARVLIANGDISSARLMLERALADGSDRAAFQLAETYDPRMLLEWKVFGLAANTARARELYGLAADRGVSAAKERLVGLD